MLDSATDKVNSAKMDDSGLLDEQSLWNYFKGGSKHSFSILYKKYYPILYNYGYHLVRDKDVVRDCLHDLFFTLWKTREKLATPASVKNYLFTAFKREVTDSIKQKGKFSHEYEESDFEITIPYENELIAEQSKQENLRKLQEAMNQLTKRQREAIFLRYYENMTYTDIAALMDCDVNSVYVLMSRAMDVLRKSYCLPFFFFWVALLSQHKNIFFR